MGYSLNQHIKGSLTITVSKILIILILITNLSCSNMENENIFEDKLKTDQKDLFLNEYK